MIYIINPHKHPTNPKLTQFAVDCEAIDGWAHNLIGTGDAELIRKHSLRFDEILVTKVQDAIAQLREEMAQP